jgi:hypothetical protein
VRAASRSAEGSSLHRLVPPIISAIASGKMAGMADYIHTIDRWDEATGDGLPVSAAMRSPSRHIALRSSESGRDQVRARVLTCPAQGRRHH